MKDTTDLSNSLKRNQSVLNLSLKVTCSLFQYQVPILEYPFCTFGFWGKGEFEWISCNQSIELGFELSLRVKEREGFVEVSECQQLEGTVDWNLSS